jgi:transposase
LKRTTLVYNGLSSWKRETRSMKEWALIHRVKKRVEEGISVSEIARTEGIDPKTVRKYRDLSVKEIKKGRREARRRSSKIKSFEGWLKNRIREYEEEGVVNCESLYRELVEMGYEGSARTVRRLVSKMRTKKRGRIYTPFETPIGFQAMVDLGESRRVRLGDGIGVMYFALMVLSWSRKKFGMWSDRPITTEMFLEFHQAAFDRFEGIPVQIVYDQTKLAVLKERYGECQFNEDFYAFARYHGFDPFVCNKYDPETKGKVESVVRYAKRGFLPGRSFVDARDVQIQWEHWVETVADAKVHETTGKIPLDLWREEKKHLKLLPAERYHAQPSMEERKVLANGLVKVLGNAYSVPSAYHGGKVLVRISDEKIELYDLERQPIYAHWKGYGKGRRFVLKEHYEKEHSVATGDLEKELAATYGSSRLVDALRARFPRHYREQLRGLIRLKRDYTAEELHEAADRAMFFSCVSFANISKILRGVTEGKPCIRTGQIEREGEICAGAAGDGRTMEYYAQAIHKLQEVQDDLA